MAKLEGHTREVRCLCALDGDRCVSGGADGVVCVWDLRRREALAVLRGHTSPVNCVIFLRQRNLGWLVSASENGVLWLWDSSYGSQYRWEGDKFNSPLL